MSTEELGAVREHGRDGQLWALRFEAPVDGVLQQVVVDGVPFEVAAECLRKWRASSTDRARFEFDSDDITVRSLRLLELGWEYREIENLRIMPLREAL